MNRFLLDANLSPKTADYLVATFGFDVLALVSANLGMLRDDEVVEIAKQQQRVVITFDLDFAEVYYLRERGKFGVIILRLEDQTVESVNRALDNLFRDEAADINFDNSLIVVQEDTVRILSAD